MKLLQCCVEHIVFNFFSFWWKDEWFTHSNVPLLSQHFLSLCWLTPNPNLHQDHTALAHWLIAHCWLSLAWSVCCASSKASDQLSRAELMHSTINTWPPIPSFIYSAVSETWPLLSPHLFSFHSEAWDAAWVQGGNKLCYQLTHWEFNGSLCLLFLSFARSCFFYRSMNYFTFRTFPPSLTFSVPTYYWWVDFTSQWCREVTVEYALCESE